MTKKNTGVLECLPFGKWKRSAFTFEGLIECLLESPTTIGPRPYRYRNGKRAVGLWPDSEIGKVVDLD